MEDYIKTSVFTSETPAGGRYDWDEGVFGITAGVSLQNPSVDNTVLVEIGKIVDDGNLNSGFVRSRPGGLLYIIEG
tara:strand:+ start:534 stop:761 length:228 start_codon:yes stop_codon:yes gene_type:complete